MAQLRAHSSRLLTAAVWGSGALLGVLVLVQFIVGWGGDQQERMINDLAYLPVTVLSAVLAGRLVRKPGLERRERRAWTLLMVSFLFQVVAHCGSIIQIFVPGLPSYPSISDYLYAVGLSFVVAGVLMLPVGR